MSTEINPATVQDELVDLFTRLCGAPDDVELAAAADRAMRTLDEQLAGAQG